MLSKPEQIFGVGLGVVSVVPTTTTTTNNNDHNNNNNTNNTNIIIIIIIIISIAALIAQRLGEGPRRPRRCQHTPNLPNIIPVLQAQEGNIYFTELAERVEYGNYADSKSMGHSQ